ncbi:hypothetical protein [Amycolatopsis sp. NPDC051372]|uniref:hypothetical protein n=1 Tax=Amycolatopsis sp. NPDC051372 TaxID=3155669 RepID=UPI003417D104
MSTVNGFTVSNAGIQLFRGGPTGLGPELQHWNTPATWKDTYGGQTDGLFCFAQDLFGRQFAITGNHEIITFDPETAGRTPIGTSLDDWAAWLLADPDVRGVHAFAGAWQDRHGPLDHDQRLLPLRLFTTGGSYGDDNLVVKDAITCMRARGPFASTIHDLPDGAQVHLMPDQLPTSTDSGADGTRLVYAELDVFADYNSFFVQDETVRFDPDDWTMPLINDLIAGDNGVFDVSTARRTTVPVILDVRTTAPTTTSTAGTTSPKPACARPPAASSSRC